MVILEQLDDIYLSPIMADLQIDEMLDFDNLVDDEVCSVANREF